MPAAGLSEHDSQDVLDFAPVLIWRSGLDKRCDWFNQTWLEFTGRSLAQELGYGWVEGVHGDDVDRCVATYERAFEAQVPFSMEYRLRRHDESFRWVLDQGRPYYREGQFAGFIGSCMDIHGHRQAERTQRLLIDELNHRVRNMLSVVQSIARQSITGDHEELLGFTGRLKALAAAHDVLTRQAWLGAPLAEVLDRALEPWRCHADRLTMHGPLVPLRPQAAVTLALAAHELCTNAVSHGALSERHGQVRIEWRVMQAPTPQLELVWHESDGPAVLLPRRRGFGSMMLERVLAAELGGTVQIDYDPAGLRCQLVAPLQDVLPEEVPQ